jgi:glucose uptake protein GlcU
MPIDGCGNSCGLIAAFIGVIGFGTFGAPLKGNTANSVNPDPFVLQTYKSTMCFLTSFLVLALGEEYKFSPYGLLSGLLWVIGGASGIFGIRNSGLALSVGTWSGITILVSFAWGIFIFDERVISVTRTLFGIVMMICGIIGMAYFSSPSVIEKIEGENDDGIEDGDGMEVENDHDHEREREHDLQQQSVQQNQQQSSSQLPMSYLEALGQNNDQDKLKQPLLEDFADDEERAASGHTSPITIDENENEHEFSDNNGDGDDEDDIDPTTVVFLGMTWNRRRLGLLGAITDGVLGGGNLIPMHYSAYKGEEYIISFATGAMLVTILFWFIRWGYNVHEQKSVKKGWDALPSMHFRTLVFPGVLAGTLWSIGNIGQIMSVTYLGESIGMSIVQSSMIVSGILGIFYFHEITGRKAIIYWSVSAFVTFIGIVFLSYEHKS